MEDNRNSHTSDTNLEKLKLYMSNSDKDFPQLDRDNLPKLMKIYFEDEDLMIAYEECSVLHEEFFVVKMQELYDQFQLQETSTKNFVDFIEFWVSKDEKLKIFYKSYDKLLEDVAKKYRQNMNQTVIEQVSNIERSQQYKKQQKQHVVQQQANKLQITENPSPNFERKIILKQNLPYFKNSSDYYLNKIHDHYSRKLLTLPKNSTFEQHAAKFRTINLTQFMAFIKDMGLLNLQSQIDHSDNSRITNSKGNNGKNYLLINKLDNSLPFKQKLDLKYYKYVFNKYSKQFRLDFEQFKAAVIEALVYLYGQQSLQSKGFNKIGINNQKNYRKTMRKIGQPLPAIQFAIKSSSSKMPYSSEKQKNVQNVQFIYGYDDYLKKSTVRVKDHENLHNATQSLSKRTLKPLNISYHSKEPKSNITTKKQSQIIKQMRKQENILSKLSINNLKKYKLTDPQQQQLCNLIGCSSPQKNRQNYGSRYQIKKSNPSQEKFSGSKMENINIFTHANNRINKAKL